MWLVLLNGKKGKPLLNLHSLGKGQLISKENFGVFNTSKKQT